jgi:hypothetical protein
MTLNDVSGVEEDVDAWLAFLKGKVALGAVDLQFSVHYGSNLNDFGMLGRGSSRAVLDADEEWNGFINCKIPIADTFFIVPEFNYWDGMDDQNGNEDPDMWHAGILWQMDF